MQLRLAPEPHERPQPSPGSEPSQGDTTGGLLRFRSMAFRRLTVYSRRNALSLRTSVSCKRYLHCKYHCNMGALKPHLALKASPERGGVPKGRRGSVSPKPPSAEGVQPPRGRQKETLTSRGSRHHLFFPIQLPKLQTSLLQSHRPQEARSLCLTIFSYSKLTTSSAPSTCSVPSASSKLGVSSVSMGSPMYAYRIATGQLYCPWGS